MDAFEQTSVNDDWHDTFSIKLGELMEEGFDPYGSDEWQYIDWYSADQETRLKHKFELRYRYYEIGITPPKVWRDMLTSRLMEIMPKYKALYELEAKGVPITAVEDEYGKRRAVYSDFPTTQIAPDNQDYASNATDNEYERVLTGDWIEKARAVRYYSDIDVMILDDLEVLFACLATVETPS